MRSYVVRVLIAADLFANVLIRGRFGETISARAWTAKRDGRTWGRIAVAVLDWLQPGHCENAADEDIARALGAVRDLERKNA